MDKAWRKPLFLSGFILLSQGFLLPSPILDAATGDWASGFSFQLPRLYVFFAPFCGIADRLTLLSYHQALVFLILLAVGAIFFLGWRRGGTALLLFVAFL